MRSGHSIPFYRELLTRQRRGQIEQRKSVKVGRHCQCWEHGSFVSSLVVMREMKVSINKSIKLWGKNHYLKAIINYNHNENSTKTTCSDTVCSSYSLPTTLMVTPLLNTNILLNKYLTISDTTVVILTNINLTVNEIFLNITSFRVRTLNTFVLRLHSLKKTELLFSTITHFKWKIFYCLK